MAALFLILDITGHAATWGGALAMFGEPAAHRGGQLPAPPRKRVTVLETTRAAAMEEAEQMARCSPGRTFGLFRAARVKRRAQAPRTRAVVRLLVRPSRPPPRRAIEPAPTWPAVAFALTKQTAAAPAACPLSQSLSPSTQ